MSPDSKSASACGFDQDRPIEPGRPRGVVQKYRALVQTAITEKGQFIAYLHGGASAGYVVVRLGVVQLYRDQFTLSWTENGVPHKEVLASLAELQIRKQALQRLGYCDTKTEKESVRAGTKTVRPTKFQKDAERLRKAGLLWAFAQRDETGSLIVEEV